MELNHSNNKLIDRSDRIFIAGHKGMVGKAIVKELLNNGYKNLLTAERKELDLEDNISVEQWFKKNKPSIVILAAAKVGGIKANSEYPYDFLINNLKIQNNIIENSFLNNVRRFLFLGSSCIYPKLCPQPIKEEYLLESSLESSNQWYAIAKISGIKLCQSLRIQHNFDSICLMPTNLYGAGDNYHRTNSHVLPSLIRKFDEAKNNNSPSVSCWGTGKPFREFLHVDDLAKACLFTLVNWDPASANAPKDYAGNPLTIMNVGTGTDTSIKELSEIIAKEFDYKGEIIWDRSKPDGTPKKLLDISKIQELGWGPVISLKDGIRLTISDYLIEKNNNILRT